MRTCVRKMSVRGKKEFEVRKMDRNERISENHILPIVGQSVKDPHFSDTIAV